MNPKITALSVEKIREALADRNLSTVADRTGLSTDTLYRLVNAKGTPTNATLLLLTIYLQGGTNGQT